MSLKIAVASPDTLTSASGEPTATLLPPGEVVASNGEPRSAGGVPLRTVVAKIAGPGESRPAPLPSAPSSGWSQTCPFFGRPHLPQL